MLTREMTGLIGCNSIGAVATIAPDGAPAVSPKATFLVLDDRTLVFAHIRSPGTIANLLRDPRVEVVFTDPFRRVGCRVKGRAAYARREAVDPEVWAKLEHRWPDLLPLAEGVVTIDCGESAMLTSPAYDLGANGDELIETWMERFADRFGYEVRRS